MDACSTRRCADLSIAWILWSLLRWRVRYAPRSLSRSLLMASSSRRPKVCAGMPSLMHVSAGSLVSAFFDVPRFSGLMLCQLR